MTAYLVSLGIYIAYFSGLFLSLGNVFSYIKGRVTLRRRLRSAVKKTPGTLESRLSSIVFLASGKEDKGRSLAMICAFLFVLSFSYSFIHFGIFFSLIIALLAASVPIVSLVSKIKKQRDRSSREGLSYVNELYRQYVIGRKNIYTALEKTSGNSSEFPVSGHHTYLLLLRLRAAESRRASRRACSDFASALGSAWAKSVSFAISCACDGDDISEALLDIIRRLKDGLEEGEERKRLNGESVRMTVFLVPAMYVFTVFLSVSYLGMDMKKLMMNQFGSSTGIRFFALIVLLFLFNTSLLSLINGSPADI
jgi:hypothetical protein